MLKRATGGDDEADEGEGNIFFVFAALCAVTMLAIWGTWALYERAKTRADEDGDEEDEQ